MHYAYTALLQEESGQDTSCTFLDLHLLDAKPNGRLKAKSLVCKSFTQIKSPRELELILEKLGTDLG